MSITSDIDTVFKFGRSDQYKAKLECHDFESSRILIQLMIRAGGSFLGSKIWVGQPEMERGEWARPGGTENIVRR